MQKFLKSALTKLIFKLRSSAVFLATPKRFSLKSTAVTLNPFSASRIECLPAPQARSIISAARKYINFFENEIYEFLCFSIIPMTINTQIFFCIKPTFKPFSHYRTLLLNIARPIVASSANSRSPPIGSPRAILDTLIPNGLINFAR